jgi:hypothetical protein
VGGSLDSPGAILAPTTAASTVTTNGFVSLIASPGVVPDGVRAELKQFDVLRSAGSAADCECSMYTTSFHFASRRTTDK